MARRWLGGAVLPIAIALVLPGPAPAHVAGSTGYAAVSVTGGTVRYRLTIGVDALATLGGAYGSLADLIARHVEILADGVACAPVPGLVTPPSQDRASVVAIVDYACPRGLREFTLRDGLPDRLGADYHTLASIERPDGMLQFVLESNRREARVAVAPAAPESASGSSEPGGVVAFFRLGVEHILTGFDHLLFLLALLLRGGSLGAVLGIVTAFTLAHSITLALAVLRIVSVPSAVVEPLIALSIAYIAAENILVARPVGRRWIESFLFGLVHGLGFAGALLELDLPSSTLARTLLSFNLGVEAGQLVAVALLLPILAWIRRLEWGRSAATILSAMVLTAGLVLLIERVADAAS
jgi:hypothetical protein